MPPLAIASRLAQLMHDPKARRMAAMPLTTPVAMGRFFADRMDLGRAHREMARALATREERFVELARRHVYGNPASPYLRLLRRAGCEFGDLAARTRRDGVDATLEALAAAGVYLTTDEFKGKCDVVRSGETFRVTLADFELSRGRGRFVSRSSGTSNQPVRAVSTVDWLREETCAAAIFLQAQQLLDHAHAAYEPMLPGASGMVFVLFLTRLGIRCDRWFARRVPTESRLEAAHHWASAYALVTAGRLFGPGFPRPTPADIGDIPRILDWVLACRRRGRSCSLRTVASSAARVARVAIEAGVSLEGLTFIASGEPLTEAKRRVIEQAGARATLLYGFEPGTVHVAYGCGRPAHTDEMHANQNTLGLIESPHPIVRGDETIRPLLVTTLHPSAALLQINVANGDYAIVERRDCGCALERAGLRQHLRQVRSYEKFTGEGLNYSAPEIYDLVESTFPAEFGGGPGDYQIVEEEQDDGRTRLTLSVHPDVGPLDEKRLLARLREGLASGTSGRRFMATIWDEAGTLRVRRSAPIASGRGKIAPFRIDR